MSAIGEYIHFTAYGYAYFGTNRMIKGTGSKNTGEDMAAAAMQAQRTKISQLANANNLNRLSPSQKLKMEKQISSLMAKPDKKSAEWLRTAWEMICEQLKIDFYEDVADQIINETGQVKGINKMKLGEKRGNYLSTILNKVNQINSLKDYIKSGQSKETIEKNLSAIEVELQQILNDATFSLDNFSLEKGQTGKDYLKSIDKNNILISSANMVDLINGCINIIKGLSNYVKGQMFQLLVTVSQLKKGQITKEAVKKLFSDQLIKQGGTGRWAGPGKSYVYLKQANFAEGVDLKSIFGSTKQTINNIECYVDGKSTDKVDVYYSFNQEEYNASVKNVNLRAYPYISLVSDASLLALMQSMDYDFVNHYINIMATHYAMPASSSSAKQEFYNQDKMRNQAKQIMNLSLLLSAFIGHKLETDTADIFIVNNNAAAKDEPRVKVFNIGELVAKAIQNESLVQVKYKDSEELKQSYLLNEFIEGEVSTAIPQRITKLLQDLHAIKIRVGFANEGLGMLKD